MSSKWVLKRVGFLLASIKVMSYGKVVVCKSDLHFDYITVAGQKVRMTVNFTSILCNIHIFKVFYK